MNSIKPTLQDYTVTATPAQPINRALAPGDQVLVPRRLLEEHITDLRNAAKIFDHAFDGQLARTANEIRKAADELDAAMLAAGREK